MQFLRNIICLAALLACITGCSASNDPGAGQSNDELTPHHFRITPDSGSATIGSRIVFKLSASTAFPKSYHVTWTFDAESLTRANVDTFSISPATTGKHNVKAVYSGASGVTLDSAATTINVTDTATHFDGGFGEFHVVLENETLDRSQYHDYCGASATFTPNPIRDANLSMNFQFARQENFNVVSFGLAGPIAQPAPGMYPIGDFDKLGGMYAFLDSAELHYVSLDGGTLTITKFDTMNNLISGSFRVTMAQRLPTKDTTMKKTMEVTFSNVGILERMFNQGAMTASLAGVPFSAIDKNGPRIIGYASPPKILRLVGKELTDTGEVRIEIHIHTPGIGSFPFGNGDTPGTAWCEYVTPNSQGGDTYNRTNCGTLIITKFDPINHRLSGTFNVSPLPVGSAQPIDITNGVLDNVAWIEG